MHDLRVTGRSALSGVKLACSQNYALAVQTKYQLPTKRIHAEKFTLESEREIQN